MIQTDYKKVQNTVAKKLNPALQDVQTKLDGIKAMESQIPENPLGKLPAAVKKMSDGAQELSAGMTTLSTSVAAFYKETESLPAAAKGIQALLDGFTQLSSYNKSLTDGAAALKKNRTTLDKGVDSLTSGAEQLAGGLNTLSTQLSAGAGKLAANSRTLRSGAGNLPVQRP